MIKAPLEKDIQAKVIGYARNRKVIARKLGFGEGWPDYMLLHSGSTCFMEFKRPGQHAEPLQKYMMDMLTAAGFDCHVVSSVDTGIALIEEWLDHVNPPNRQPKVVDYAGITKELLK